MENKISYICFDCKRELENGEEFMSYPNNFIKCRACHKKEPKLLNFQKTEVYSRVVGYIRPIEQWNKGKQEEFGDRVEFDIKK